MWSWIWDVCAIYGAYKLVVGAMHVIGNHFSMLAEVERHKKKK